MRLNTEEIAKERLSRIWQVIAAVPAGKVVTYGQVAELAGLGRGARQVGAALRNLPPGSRLAWHRVINAQGKISFRGGSSVATQQALLEADGVLMHNGRIDLKQYRWQP